MEIYRSILFIPADKKKMLDKIDVLHPDAFILDLEDSVSTTNKEIARNNIKEKLSLLSLSGKIIFVRLNDLDSSYIKQDVENTVHPNLKGYIIPKFEDFFKLKDLFRYIAFLEKKKSINSKIKIILMVETSMGISEIRSYQGLLQIDKEKRVIGIALGAEDYQESLSQFSQISIDMIDFARKEIIVAAKSSNLLAIDTVYRDFKDSIGLKKELKKIIAMGFNSKLAIHPSQIKLINTAFTPGLDEIKTMNLILKYKEKIEKEGAIAIGKEIYDLPHLKWAVKLKKYIKDINSLNKSSKD